jgi:hypothetical protein
MPDQEAIRNQQTRLAAFRHTLAARLDQQAQLGVAHTPPDMADDIRAARDNIRRIKSILRGWGVVVEDAPDDEDPAGGRPARVFLSYKRNSAPDQPVAMEVFEALNRQHEVFIDQTMPVGARWAERIESELRRSDFLITFLSERSIHSEMVIGEITTAHRLASVQGGHPMIIPVRLAYGEPFAYPLSAYLDPLNWAIWESPADTPRLIAELTRAVSGGSLPPASTRSNDGAFQPAPAQSIPQPTPLAQVGAARAPRAIELPEGTMDTASDFYVARPSDQLALDAIGRQGVTITIKGPRQMGKSSLLIRVIDTAKQVGKRVAFLDFQLFDHASLADADQFFRQFCVWLADELDLDDRVDEYWNLPLGNSQRCTRYVGRYILESIGGPLVLAMDEVESIFDSAFRSDFFGMLRSWHNRRASASVWKNLDLALVTSTEPYQLIENLNQSPFNVGQVIELNDFTAEQVHELNRRHGWTLSPTVERQLIDLLGGHPYLIRRAMYLIASGRIEAHHLFAEATADRGPFGDHLRYHLFRLHENKDLIQSMLQVIRYNRCDDQRTFFRLRGAGLVRREGGAVVPRCRLYEGFFREHLHD